MVHEKSESKEKKHGFLIKEMELDDLSPVFHLGERLFTADVAPNLYRTWDQYEVVNYFLSDSEYCLVAKGNDQVVGFALGTTISKPRSAWKYAYLVWLGVDPAYHQEGIGEKLFEHFKAIMLEQGVRIIFVDTEADNLSALSFFRKMGFGSPRQHIYLSLNLSGQGPRRHGARPPSAGARRVGHGKTNL